MIDTMGREEAHERDLDLCEHLREEREMRDDEYHVRAHAERPMCDIPDQCDSTIEIKAGTIRCQRRKGHGNNHQSWGFKQEFYFEKWED